MKCFQKNNILTSYAKNYVWKKKSGYLFLNIKFNSIPIDDAYDLLQQMLVLNPDKRISAENALQHKYFTSNPLPTEITSMFKLDTEHRVRDLKLQRE